MLSRITEKELAAHKEWLEDSNKGERIITEGNADLRNANLRYADLSNADLSNADLSNANLRNAKNLDTVKSNEGTSFFAMQCPEEGAFIGWKKCQNNVIVKLLIPAEAKRSSATTRKCRAEFVNVLEVIGAKFGVSDYDESIVYRVGERVTPKNGWNEDRWTECGAGIHFFITRKEAENYNS